MGKNKDKDKDKTDTPDAVVYKSNFFRHLRDKLRQENKNIFSLGIKNILHEYNDFNKIKETEYKKYLNYENVVSNAKDTVEYYILLILSCLIATLGLFQDSAATIIGAMIVAPLMGPIFGISASVLWGNYRDLFTSFLTLLKGIAIVIAITSLLTFLLPFLKVTDQIIARTNPNFADIFVALFCGFIGAYAYVNNKISTAIPGVAISVALMPPLSTVGIGIGMMRPNIIYGASVLFLINLIGISLAAIIVFSMVKLHPVREETEHVRKRIFSQVVISSLLLIGIIGVLTLMSYQTYQNDNEDKIIRNTIESETEAKVFSITINRKDLIVETIILGNGKQDRYDKITIEKSLAEKTEKAYSVRLFIIRNNDSVENDSEAEDTAGSDALSGDAAGTEKSESSSSGESGQEK